jgi:hypothetical protein
MTQRKISRINRQSPYPKMENAFNWSLGEIAFSNILERETKPKKKYEKKKKKL